MGALKPDFDINLPLLHPLVSKNEPSAIRSDIILGSPAAGCTGLGVCKMMITTPFSIRYKCPAVSAWLSVTSERRLRVSFVRESMDLRVQRRHFRWHLFQVLEAFVIPDDIARCLPGLLDRTIQPGIYTVWETVEHLVVDF